MLQSLTHAPMYIFKVMPDAEFDPQQAIYLVSSLIELGPVAFQIIARPEGIRWQAIDLSGRQYSLSTLQSPQLKVDITRFNTQKKCRFPFYRAKLSFQTTHAPTNPLPMIDDYKSTGDPLLPLTKTLSFLRDDEEVRYTVLVEAPKTPLLFQGLALADAIFSVGDLASQVDIYEQIIRHKQQQTWYKTFVGLDIDCPNPHRAIDLRQAIALQLTGAYSRNQTNHPPNGLMVNGYPDVFLIKNSTSFMSYDTLGWYVKGLHSAKVREWWESRWLYLNSLRLLLIHQMS